MSSGRAGHGRKRRHGRGRGGAAAGAARHSARALPRGRIELTRGGYGFVQTAEGEFFIPANKVKGAFPGDLVEVYPIRAYDDAAAKGGPVHESHGRKRTGGVASIIERSNYTVIGYIHKAEPFAVVRPADPAIHHDIFTPLKDAPPVEDGAVVRVEMLTFPDRNSAATGRIVEVISANDDHSLAIDLIVARHKLETEFSIAALEEASKASVAGHSALNEGYVDLRDRLIFTIDPTDAKDFDDALSISRITLANGEAGYELGVSIADVSYYVPWDSSIDLEARRRATSVYLPGRVIPMLPENLSDNICSLRPGEERRTFTVDMTINSQGEIVGAKPYLALIKSQCRLTYDQALQMLQGSAVPLEAAASCGDAIKEALEILDELAKVRKKRRHKLGGLDFDTKETKVILAEDGEPVALEERCKNDATELVEEAMIAANEAVATLLHDSDYPCLYRVHDAPPPSAMTSLIPVLEEFAWFKDISARRIKAADPFALQWVLETAKGRPEEELITMLVLRAQARAVYSPEIGIHFGLASKAYAHFTSPIRRYPDLVVHRMLRAMLWGRPERFYQEVSSLAWIARHSSDAERIAEKASREALDAKIIEYMESYVGQTFSGLIVGVGSYGLSVRLENGAEGVVDIRDLGNEYFVLNSERYTLTGSDSGKVYRLGRNIALRLVEADPRTRTLRFKLEK